MKKIVCDICGREVIEQSSKHDNRWYKAIFAMVSSNKNITFDLCGPCEDAITNLLSAPKETGLMELIDDYKKFVKESMKAVKGL